MIVHLSLSGAPSVIAKLLHEDADYMYVEYPVIYMKEETIIYTLPLLPFADKGKVQGEYGDVPVSYLGLRDLVANKKASGRKKDLADLEALGED